MGHYVSYRINFPRSCCIPLIHVKTCRLEPWCKQSPLLDHSAPQIYIIETWWPLLISLVPCTFLLCNIHFIYWPWHSYGFNIGTIFLQNQTSCSPRVLLFLYPYVGSTCTWVSGSLGNSSFLIFCKIKVTVLIFINSPLYLSPSNRELVGQIFQHLF